ncbi:hypothetical protein G6F31_021659 [Rhizopus arrhizus]|nr:hypothetical protein G6F31_021659 [Rhizopus arrhizus]
MLVFGIVQAGRLDVEDLQDGARDDPERFHRAAQDGLVAGFQDAEVELAVQSRCKATRLSSCLRVMFCAASAAPRPASWDRICWISRGVSAGT